MGIVIAFLNHQQLANWNANWTANIISSEGKFQRGFYGLFRQVRDNCKNLPETQTVLFRVDFRPVTPVHSEYVDIPIG